MKLLFDENLSPALVGVLADVYPGAEHVVFLGLRSPDETIWSYAAKNDYVIVSKDADFYERSVSRGAPPNVIWLRAVNVLRVRSQHFCEMLNGWSAGLFLIRTRHA